MNTDDPFEWLSQQESFRKIHDGEDLTPERLGQDFLRMNNAERSNILADLNRKIAASDLSLTDAVRLHRFRRHLNDAHQAARRVNR